MKIFLASILVCVACLSVSFGADVTPEAVEVIRGFAAKQESALSNLRSYDMSGTIKIVQSEEQAKAQNPPSSTISQRRFRIIADANEIKEAIETLDEAGKVSRTEVYYLNEKRVIWADNGNGFSVQPFVLAAGNNNGLFNDCPAFLEDSFLNLDITGAGIPALLASDLSSKERWTQVIQHLQSAQIGSDQHVYATIAGTAGRSTIELIKQPDSTGDYQVASLSFIAEEAKDSTIKRKIDVLSVSDGKNFGAVGKTFKMNIYTPPSEVPLVTWEYTITDMKLNCPVDAEALQFIPRSVTSMDDAEKGCRITAVK